MRSSKERSAFLLGGVHDTVGEHEMQHPDEFVHGVDHGLPVRTLELLTVYGHGLAPLLPVVVAEDGVVGDASLCHEEHVFPEDRVAVLGDVSPDVGLPALADSGVGPHVGDELLVGLEAVDVSDLRHELCGLYLADAGHGGDDGDGVGMDVLLDLEQCGGEHRVTLGALGDTLGAVPHAEAVQGDADGVPGKLPEPLGGKGDLPSLARDEQGVLQCLVACVQDFPGVAEERQEMEHPVGKHIHGKQFGECHGDILLEDGLGFPRVIGVRRAPARDDLALGVRHGLSLRKACGAADAVLGDRLRVDPVRLRVAQRQGLLVAADEHRIDDKRTLAPVQEKVAGRQVVESRGLHEEQHVGALGILVREQGLHARHIQGERTLVHGLASRDRDSIVGVPAGDIDSNDFHKRISRSRKNNRSLCPISRVKKAQRPNQPIGMMETEDRLLAKLENLNRMLSSVPRIYRDYESYALHCRANNT